MRALAALALAVLLANGPAAATSFDGSWGIQVMTERGACDPVYRYYIVIQDSAVHVRSMSEVAPQPAGRINPSGRIDTRIGAPDDPVGIRGRLEGASGSGRWTAPVTVKFSGPP